MDGMDLRDQLDALDVTPNSSVAYREPPSEPVDNPLMDYLRANGRVDQLKAAITNSNDMAHIDAASQSTADQHQGMMGEWEKEIAHQQAMLDNPEAGQSVENLKSGLAYAQQKYQESKSARDKAKQRQTDSLSDPSVGLSSFVLGMGQDIGYAVKQYGESAGSPGVSEFGAGLAQLSGESLKKDVPPPLPWADVHGLSGFGRYAGQTGGTIAAMLAVGAVSESLLITSFLAAGQGQMRAALEDAGVTDKSTLAKGTYTYGTLMGAVQAVAPVVAMRGITGPAMSAFTGTIAKLSADAALNVTGMALTQRLAMGLSTWAQTYGIYDLQGKPIDWNEVATRTQEAMREGLASGAIFGVAGEAGRAAGGGYERTSSKKAVQSLLGTADEIAKARSEIARDQYAKQFADELAAFDAARSEPTAPETPPVDTAALQGELGTLATERSPEADARRAEIETQLAAAEPKPEEAASPEDAHVLAELQKQDEAIGEPIMSEAYAKLTAPEKAEISRRAQEGEHPADLVEEVTIRGVQVKSYLDDNDLSVTPEVAADISGRMADGTPIDEAIASYAQEQFQAETRRRQGQTIAEGNAASADGETTAAAAVDSGTATGGGESASELGVGRAGSERAPAASELGANPQMARPESVGESAGASSKPVAPELQRGGGEARPAVTDEQRNQFHDILRGSTPRRQWAQALGADPAQLSALIAEAEKDGLLRVDRNGVVRRTAKAKTEPTPQEMLAIRAYHGSPHDFEEFKLDKIGTGEGNQAYGAGLYFAENEGVASDYRIRLAKNTPEINSARSALNKKLLEHAVGNASSDDVHAARTALTAAEAKASGNLYKVSINVEPYQLLDWDKPLSEQSEKIRDAMWNAYEGFRSDPNSPLLARKQFDELKASDAYQTMARSPYASLDKASAALREAGIPGIKYLDQGSRGASDGTSNYVIFDDKLVKITHKDGKPVSVQERADALDQMHQDQDAKAKPEDQMLALRGFYSPAIRAAEAISQEKGTGEQFWKQITKNPGVKKDELDWMGLEEFLKGKKSVTKAEVLDFMRANQVQLDEKVLTDKAFDETNVKSEAISEDDFAKRLGLNEHQLRDKNVDKVWSYKSDNSEVFIVQRLGDGRYTVYGQHGSVGATANFEEAKHIATGELASTSEMADQVRFKGYKVPGGSNYRELLIRLPELESVGLTHEELLRKQALLDARGTGVSDRENLAIQNELNSLRAKERPSYTSKHFRDQELVHLRVDDRTGPNGEKVLFINEVQSDLHQQGRVGGYKGGKEGNLSEGLRLRPQQDGDAWKVYDGQGNLETDRSFLSREDAQAFADEKNTSLQTEAHVPNAPFKGDLWLELALKRALQYATENGYDAISWARSDQIAKAVGAEPEKLALQYDQKIGKFLDKYTKKWGGKVEEANVGAKSFDFHSLSGDERNRLADAMEHDGHIVEAEEVRDNTVSVDTAMFYLNKYANEFSKPEDSQNQILRITPEMRASVEKGQPLFARGDSEGRSHAVRQLTAGHAVDIDRALVTQNVLALYPVARILPKDVSLGVLSRLEPVKGKDYYKGTFTAPDGSTFVVRVERHAVEKGRASFDPVANAILSFRFGSLPRGDGGVRTLSGEAYHETAHALWGRLTPDVRSALIAHAENLRIMDLSFRDYLKVIGDPSATNAKRQSLRYVYEWEYRGRKGLKDLIQQEAVAHMVELYSHGILTDEHVGPVKHLLDGIIDGSIVAEKQIDTPAFRRWFMDSKVVDENGKPLVVYHGTDAEFNAFNVGQIGTGIDANQFMGGIGFLGRGFYFGPSERKAADYGDNVVAVYLSLQRPLMLGKGAEFDQIVDALRKIAGRDAPRSEATEILRAAGYDGIIKKDYHYHELDEYVAFDPEQIKSAIGNRGTFDPNNPDISFAKRAQKSPIQETFDDIRAELGLKEPERTRKDRPPTLRQQIIAIATNGGEQIMKLYAGKLAPILQTHADTIQDFALPLSTDRVGEGFSRFFREFVLRPNDLRQRQRALYDDFSDMLDAEAPQLLEAIDKMHELGRQHLAEIRAKAASGGSGGRTPPPSGGTPPAGPAAPGGQPPRKIPFADTFRFFSDNWKRTFQPELVSTKALEADPLFARYRAATAQDKDSIVARGEELWSYWNKVPEQQRLDFLKAVDTGAPQPTPELSEIAYRYRKLLDQAHRDEAVYGSKAAYVEEYLPRQYEDPEGVKQFFKAKSAVQNLGPKWFEKERHFELLEEALKAGFKLRTTNPEEVIANRLMAGADMRMRMELLQELEKRGLARRVKELNVRTSIGANGGPALDPNDGFSRSGWQAINAPNMEQWLIAPDIQPIWKNAVEAKGLWGNDQIAGSVFRKWMAFKNAWVPIKLSISFFHPLHVLHINQVNNLARGWTQLTRGGDIAGALKSWGTAFDPRQGIGYEARHAWLKPESERTPQERAMVNLMTDGGFSPQLSEDLRIAARRSLARAWEEGAYHKLPWQALKRGMELVQSRIFERWIPGVKAAAYLKEAQALFERRPDLLDNNIQRRVALRAIAKSVDNRFGEMFYGTLFWNPTLKHSLQGAFLSLGWQTGMFREFGGAAIETGARQFSPSSNARATIWDATNKRAYSVIYMTTAMMIGGAMTYAFTGEAPKDVDDVIFPRIGGKNPDGSPRRVSTMFYTREIPMLMKHIQEQGGGLTAIVPGAVEMMYNKMLIQPFIEFRENRDYWGYEIWDENASWWKKPQQFAMHILKDQLSPITISGASRSAQLGGSWMDKGVPLALLGFGPAPSYVERTALENRIQHLYKTFVAPLKKPYEREAIDQIKRDAKTELRLALQNGDMEAAQKARAALHDVGVSGKYLTQSKLNTPTTTYLFSRLPPETQRAVLNDALPEEVNTYRKYANRKIRQEFPARVDARQAAPEMAH